MVGGEVDPELILLSIDGLDDVSDYFLGRTLSWVDWGGGHGRVSESTAFEG